MFAIGFSLETGVTELPNNVNELQRFLAFCDVLLTFEHEKIMLCFPR